MGLPSSERGRCEVVLVIFKKSGFFAFKSYLSPDEAHHNFGCFRSVKVRGNALEKNLVSRLPCGSPAPRAPQQGPCPPHSPIETGSAVNVSMCVCEHLCACVYVTTLTHMYTHRHRHSHSHSHSQGSYMHDYMNIQYILVCIHWYTRAYTHSSPYTCKVYMHTIT